MALSPNHSLTDGSGDLPSTDFMGCHSGSRRPPQHTAPPSSETSGFKKDHEFWYALRSSGPVKPLPWIWMKMMGLRLPTLPVKWDQMVLGKQKAWETARPTDRAS